MKTFGLYSLVPAAVFAGALIGCSSEITRSADVSARLRNALDQAGYKHVWSSQDRDKGVVTLSGHVATDLERVQVESLAKSIVGTQLVSNHVLVIPPTAKSNRDAALTQARVPGGPGFSIKNSAADLTGPAGCQPG